MNRQQRRSNDRKGQAGAPAALAALVAAATEHHAAGRLPQAAQLYEQALALQPNLADVRARLATTTYNLGNAAARSGDVRTAAGCYARAIALQPGFAEAQDNLVQILLAGGDARAALDAAMRGIERRATPRMKRWLVQAARDAALAAEPAGLRGLLVRAFAEGWSRPADLSRAASHLLRLDPGLTQPPSGMDFAGLGGNTLLQAQLISAPVTDPQLEDRLTAVRTALLETEAGAHLELRCALARQCFINEYVFAVRPEEAATVQRLKADIAAALATGSSLSPHRLATCACYEPLGAIPGAPHLQEREWPEAVAALIRQQVSEPAEEGALQSSMPRLTSISAGVSTAVREQYEENPYPRWVVPSLVEATSLHAFVRRQFPAAQGQGPAGDSPAILVAGCGTGQHPITTARRFPEARILAVDLSLASIGHAARKTKEIGQPGIEYAQADILQLAALPRRFDLVEASGVLHHLHDPFEGWRILAGLVKPGGLMRIGLYSARGREHVAAARALIAAEGFQPTADGIRRARKALAALPAGALARHVTESSDFFSLSSCRDLIFHVQEHRLALPDIAGILPRLHLRFLGFDVDTATRQRFLARFGAQAQTTDLMLWDQFEAENPTCFTGMYQFWVQRAQ